jgi:hypothetical protein
LGSLGHRHLTGLAQNGHRPTVQKTGEISRARDVLDLLAVRATPNRTGQALVPWWHPYGFLLPTGTAGGSARRCPGAHGEPSTTWSAASTVDICRGVR